MGEGFERFGGITTVRQSVARRQRQGAQSRGPTEFTPAACTSPYSCQQQGQFA
jgi:hypothetical protein